MLVWCFWHASSGDTHWSKTRSSLVLVTKLCGDTQNSDLTWQMLSTARFVPLFLHLQKLVAQGVFGLVGVRLWSGFLVGVQVREQIRRPSEHWREDGGLAVTVHAETALAGDFDQSRWGTGGWCQRNIGGAKGHAAHRPVDTGALVFAARVEVFSVLIHAAVVFTRAAFQFGWKDKEQTGAGLNWSELMIKLIKHLLFI